MENNEKAFQENRELPEREKGDIDDFIFGDEQVIKSEK